MPGFLVAQAPSFVQRTADAVDHSHVPAVTNDMDPNFSFSDGLDDLYEDFNADGSLKNRFSNIEPAQAPTYMPTYEEINGSIAALQHPQQPAFSSEQFLGPMVGRASQRNDADLA